MMHITITVMLIIDYYRLNILSFNFSIKEKRKLNSIGTLNLALTFAIFVTDADIVFGSRFFIFFN